MRGSSRAALTLAVVLAAAGCSGGWVDMDSGGTKRTAEVRAARRAYDGAPPVAPHDAFGIACDQCHNERGMDVPDVGFAPASPHAATAGMGATSRCRQCHVFAETGERFVANGFEGLRQDLRPGERLHSWAPPVMPHKAFMRENCRACHTGPAAREAIRTSHPERLRCRQCHVPVLSRAEFPPSRTAAGS